jgi:hypothetical protein
MGGKRERDSVRGTTCRATEAQRTRGEDLFSVEAVFSESEFSVGARLKVFVRETFVQENSRILNNFSLKSLRVFSKR